MAEKLIAAGVFTNENDLTYVPQGVENIGAAIIGPTVKGRALVPTKVKSYAEFQTKFGDTFKSGSDYYEYFTSISAREYLKNSDTLTVTRIMAGAYLPATASVSGSSSPAFTLTTLSEGLTQNSFVSTSSSAEVTNGLIPTGTKDNLRWEISNVNNSKGTFTLTIRRGNDNAKRKVVLETWSGCSLDPNASNYIAKKIGDMTYRIAESGTTAPYLKPTGSYENKSEYVRVEVLKQTVDYIDENGNIRVSSASGSLPGASSGSFGGGSDGVLVHPQLFFKDATGSNTQGYVLNGADSGSDAYLDAIYLLGDVNSYDFNLLTMPGVFDDATEHEAIVDAAEAMIEDRADAFLIVDPCVFNQPYADVITETGTRDSNYMAHYWPWAKIPSQVLNRDVWVPASTLLAGVLAFNDKVGYEWYAPAGLNRAALSLVKEVERKLTKTVLDDLYDANVNPLATFSGTGVVVWGQKTLQKKESALDRVNVRRLLIKSKKYVASVAKYLVFEPNVASTRATFVNTVTPWFESVQQKNGLYDFRVVMDESNNTADVIDRLELRAAIWLKPTKAAEYIVIDFNILPTGTSFPTD